MQADALGLLCSIHQLQNIFLCVLIASDFPNGKSWYSEILLEPIEFKTFLVIAEMAFTEIHCLLQPLRSSSNANQSYMFPFVANYETVLRFDSKHFEQSSFSCSEIMLAEKLQFFRSYNWDVNLRPGIYSSKTSPYFYFRTMLSKILKVFLQIRCRNFPCWRWGETWTIEWWRELVNGFVRAWIIHDECPKLWNLFISKSENTTLSAEPGLKGLSRPPSWEHTSIDSEKVPVWKSFTFLHLKYREFSSWL